MNIEIEHNPDQSRLIELGVFHWPRAATGWPLNVAAIVDLVAAPSDDELRVLRDLHERTRRAHRRPVPRPV